jgi:hypothetical protein
VILHEPAVIPVTTPLPEPTVAIAVLELVQTPPLTVLLRVVVKLVPTVVMPVSGGIEGLTFTIW